MKLRAAVMLDSPLINQWEFECIEKLLDLKFVQIDYILRNRENFCPNDRGSFLFQYLEKRMNQQSTTRQNQDVHTILPDVKVISFQDDGASLFHQLESMELDFILKFSGCELNSDFIRWPKYGIWEFAYGDNENITSSLYSYWNLSDGHCTGTISLRKLGVTHQDGITLMSGTLPTILHSYVENTDAMNKVSMYWPAYVCRDIFHGSASYLYASSKLTQRTHKPLNFPTNLQTLHFTAKLAMIQWRRWCTQWFFMDHWNVGIVNQPIERFLTSDSFPEVKWIPRQENYIADPFGIIQYDQLYLLVEEYSHLTRKGVITAIQYDNEHESVWQETSLELPVHMSYPYLLQHNNEIFCIPETSQAREILLYKAVEFPNEWVKVGALIDNFDAVDATVFQHNDYWWLFCTDKNTGPNTHLHIWYASELTGEWKPHALNPVKIDVRSSRPAGTPFYENGSLYRPAQDCSETYGGAIQINKIVTLTEQEFKEEPVKRILPDPHSPYKKGIHTISAVGNLTIIDAKTVSFNIKVFIIRATKKLRSKWNRWVTNRKQIHIEH